jgi:hypothetical protein
MILNADIVNNLEELTRYELIILKHCISVRLKQLEEQE